MTTEPTPFEKFREFTKMFPFPNPKSTSAKNTIKRLKPENGEQPVLKVNQRFMAYAVGESGIKRRVACSLKGTLDKVRKDAIRLKERKVRLDVLVFMTPVPRSNLAILDWCEVVQKEFQYRLHVIAQRALTMLLEEPRNAWLCRDYLHLDFADEAGGIGRYTHAVLLNPYKIRKEHKKRKSAGFLEDLWNALLVRVTEIVNNGAV